MSFENTRSKLAESYQSLIEENIPIDSNDYKKILLFEKIIKKRRDEIEAAASKTDFHSVEFISLENKLIEKGFLKDSKIIKFKRYILLKIKPFTLGAIVTAVILPNLIVDRLVLRSNENNLYINSSINNNQISEQVRFESTDPKSLANVINNKAIELDLEVINKMENEEVSLFISGFKNTAIESDFKKDLGILNRNIKFIKINIKMKK